MSSFLIVIPAYNEEELIQSTILRLQRFIAKKLTNKDITVIISDNNSTDQTAVKVQELISDIPFLGYVFVPQQGKGSAIKEVWSGLIDRYDYFIFMDADLATDLEALPRMIEALETHDLVCGDRYHPHSSTERILKREVISLAYRILTHALLSPAVSDYPCGFKGCSQQALRELLPLIKNDTWFFDSELAYRAYQNNCTICNLPVLWKDPRSKVDQSKVSLPKVSLQYIKELFRLKRGK